MAHVIPEPEIAAEKKFARGFDVLSGLPQTRLIYADHVPYPISCFMCELRGTDYCFETACLSNVPFGRDIEDMAAYALPAGCEAPGIETHASMPRDPETLQQEIYCSSSAGRE